MPFSSHDKGAERPRSPRLSSSPSPLPSTSPRNNMVTTPPHHSTTAKQNGHHTTRSSRLPFPAKQYGHHTTSPFHHRETPKEQHILPVSPTRSRETKRTPHHPLISHPRNTADIRCRCRFAGAVRNRIEPSGTVQDRTGLPRTIRHPSKTVRDSGTHPRRFGTPEPIQDGSEPYRTVSAKQTSHHTARTPPPQRLRTSFASPEGCHMRCAIVRTRQCSRGPRGPYVNPCGHPASAGPRTRSPPSYVNPCRALRHPAVCCKADCIGPRHRM
ncbi:hypothetical protein Uis4E_1136 [Bifidobacterium parmae]|uniref:Uncharacterized protein n=1 Tax=Bifidobacterium parmae TaxID=361854 RepID=A0A2N5J3H4_9BIFI|nr:hypothetical protein Uis4E_1136 [Bifidobacterium parmae]